MNHIFLFAVTRNIIYIQHTKCTHAAEKKQIKFFYNYYNIL